MFAKQESQFSECSQSGFVSTNNLFEGGEGNTLSVESLDGATCVTYKVFQENRFLFVKQLKEKYLNDKKYKEVFEKEFETGRKLDSEYFPHYIKYVEDHGTPTIIMEYIDGKTLSDVLSSNPGYFRNKVNRRRFLMQLLEGLDVLHTHQVVHLDLKPQNIMLTSVNNDVRIIDLGYCYTDSVPFLQGKTRAFAAPEQLDNNRHVDACTDIYSVGKIIKFILKEANVKDTTLNKIANRCVLEDPSLRYQNVSEISRDLSSVLWRNRVALAVCVFFFVVGMVLVTYCHFINDYDLNVEIESLNTQLYFRYINDQKELEVTYKYTWGNTYSHDFAVPHEISIDGRMVPITSVGDSAFRKSELAAVTLPSTITCIGAEAFDCCRRLSFLSVPDNVKEIGFASFAGCSALSVIRLSRNIKEIPRSCFFDSGITSIDIPEGVTIIRQDAFVGCNKLKEVTLPATLTTIERGAFFHCQSLETISIPKSVTTIGDFVLWECPNLKVIYNYSPNPQACTGVVKKGFSGVVYVPAQSVNDYRKTTGWKGLNIQPMP